MSGSCRDCGGTMADAADGAPIARCVRCGSTTGDSADSTSTGDPVLAAIVEEFETALAKGAGPSIDDYCRRHPRLSARLRGVLSTVERLASANDESRASTDLPESLGPYRIVARLGAGGMGVVYRARDDRLGRDVALKVLTVGELGGETARQRFLREAKALARLTHPRVVPIHDVGEAGPHMYIAMDLLESSLAELADRHERTHGGPLPPATVVPWLLDAADGLAHLHASGAVHRDVKPGNLLVGSDGRVRIADLGLARVEGDVELTKSGTALGTIRYAAPEQLRGEEATPTSDVHGLGATAWRLLTASPPPHSVPRSWPRTIPRPLRPVLARALNADPALRYRDAGEMARALRRALGPARHARAALLVAAALAAALALRPWSSINRAVGSAGPDAASLRQGVIAHPVDAAYLRDGGDRMVLWLRSRGITFDDLLAPLAEGDVKLVLAGRPHVARISVGQETIRASLLAGDRELQSVEIASRQGLPPSAWRFRSEALDVDGDGIEDVVLTNGTEAVLVRWDPQALGIPDLGWRYLSSRTFGEGSPVIVDWGDGSPVVLAGDSGRDVATGRSEAAHLLEVRLEDGTLRREMPVATPVQSTPQFLRDGSGRVVAAYLDLEGDVVPFRGGGLVAIDPESLDATPVEVPGEGRLTWPAFADSDGDGRDELIVGREIHPASGSDGVVACLDPDRDHAVAWTALIRGPASSYPVLSQQDEDAALEACFATWSSFTCLDLEGDLDPSDRVAWEAHWQGVNMPASAPVEIGDLDGDGLAELALGGDDGAVRILGRRAGGVLARLELPPECLDRGALPRIIGRCVSLPGAGPGEARLLAVTANGWIARWRVKALAVEAAPPLRAGAPGETTASPVLVEIPPSGDRPARPGVLVLSDLVWLFEVPDDPLGPLVPAWSTWSCQGCAHGTPAWHREGDRAWVVFTRPDGALIKAPMLQE